MSREISFEKTFFFGKKSGVKPSAGRERERKRDNFVSPSYGMTVNVINYEVDMTSAADAEGLLLKLGKT